MINIINDYKDAQLLPNLPLILKHLILSQLFVKDQLMLLDKNEKSTKKILTFTMFTLAFQHRI